MKGKNKLTTALLAALAAAGCSSKDAETEYVYVDQQQTPIASLKAISSDGEYAALNMQEKTDLETMLFNNGSGTLSNLSNDPENSDFAQAFAGHHLITKKRNNNDEETINVYDASTGQLVYTSENFSWINRIVPYPDGSRVLFSGVDGSHYSHVMTHAIGSDTAEKLFPTATSSHIEAQSEDNSIIFLYTYNPSLGDTLHMMKTADNSVVPLINMCCQNVIALSRTGAKAVIYDWSNDLIKTVDTETAGVQLVSMPSGKEFCDAEYISENGIGVLLEMEDESTDADEFWHLNTETGTLEFITQREVGTAFRYPRAISPDGTIVAIDEYDAPGDNLLIYNSTTQELYNPLLGIATEWVNFRGFSADGKAIIEYDDDATGDNITVMHDYATKNNTVLGDSANYVLYSTRNPTQDRKYLPIDGADLATGWQVVLLEDLINGGRKVISQPGFDISYIGSSPDNNHLLLRGRDGISTNLFVYDIADDTIEQVTNNTDPRLDWIYIREHSKDGSNAYFEEGFDNGTGLLRELDYETGEVKDVSYQ